MDRREFLLGSMLTAAGLTSGVSAAETTAKPSRTEEVLVVGGTLPLGDE